MRTTIIGAAAIALLSTTALVSAQQSPGGGGQPQMKEQGATPGGGAGERKEEPRARAPEDKGGAGAKGDRSAEPKDKAGDTKRSAEPKDKAGDRDRTAEPKDKAGDTKRSAEPKDRAGDRDRTAEPKDKAGDTKRRAEPKDTAGDRDRTAEPKDKAGDTKRSAEPKDQAGDRGRAADKDRMDRDRSKDTARDRDKDKAGDRGRAADKDRMDRDRSKDTARDRDQDRQRDQAQGKDGQRDGSRVTLSQEQRTQVRTRLSSHREARVTNVNFSINIGTRVPRDFRAVRVVPDDIVAIVPQYRGYRYFIYEERVVIIHPQRYEIVEVIEVDSGPRRGGAVTATLSLSPAQRTLIIERIPRGRIARGVNIDLALGAELPSTVELYEFPEEILVEVPSLKPYRYVLLERRVAVVDPSNRAVIEVLDL
jgi:hypothetical protein